MSMTRVLLFTAALALAQSVTAQPAPTPPPAEPGTSRAELDEARRALAEAARRVAELSAGEADRWIREFEVRQVEVPPVRLGVMVGESTDDGIALDSVSKDSPAAKAGLKDGDVLVELNGRSLADAERRVPPALRIYSALEGAEPGDAVKVKYRRGQRAHEATVTLAAGPTSPVAFAFGSGDGPFHTFAMPDLHDLPGIAPGVAALARLRAFGNYEFVQVSDGLGEYFNTDKGLLVVRVGEENPLGLKDGDVLLAIDGREPDSATHAARILRSYAPGEEASVEIMRERRKQTLKVQMPDDR